MREAVDGDDDITSPKVVFSLGGGSTTAKGISVEQQIYISIHADCFKLAA
jgi:hypothetical protein